jgi:hypothetical protein
MSIGDVSWGRSLRSRYRTTASRSRTAQRDHRTDRGPRSGVDARPGKLRRSAARSAALIRRVILDRLTTFGHAAINALMLMCGPAGPDAFGLHQERTTTTLPDARPSPT